MKTVKIIFYLLASLIASSISAQTIVVTDDAAYTTGEASSVLDVKSASKGLLPPRMTQAQRLAISGPADGLVVYQTDSTKGLYYRRDTTWMKLSTESQTLNTVVKTANDTLKKTDNFVLARNGISLVLPVITSADNGLSITVKNDGTHTDLTLVLGNGGALIDSSAYIGALPRYSYTMVAKDGNWYIKNRSEVSVTNILVNWASSMNSIEKAIEFLNAHMIGPTVIRVESGVYSIPATITVDLPYTLTIEGSSYGTTILESASGLSGHEMFHCMSECYFKMLVFDGTGLSGYGNSAGEDAIHLLGTGEYHEIKDCSFDHFNKAITLKTNLELWLFECDITNSIAAGVEIAAGAASGLILKISEVDFTACEKGINMLSGVNATVSATNCGFYNSGGTSVGINYVPATFTSVGPIFISNNTWNNTGTFISGFDFTRSDGRDASISILNNVGIADQRPSCKINVLNNTTSLSVGSSWVKANWSSGTQTGIPVKFTIATNKQTYQPTNKRNLIMWISGNAICTSASSRTINIGVVKNGASSVRYGETTVRLTNSGQPFQWSTVVFISNAAPGDYYEIWTNMAASGPDDIVFQDLTWLTVSQ